MFNEPCVEIKWGESISENSTAVKKVSGTYEGWIFGDKVDMRILTQIKGKAYDVLNGEHANDVPEDNKYYAEHRKVLREAKDTLDCLFEKQYLPPTECKRLVVPSFQATDLDGEVMAVTLPVPGLCMAQRIGYLPIPSTASELKDMRKCIKRMLFMKRHVLMNAKLFGKAVEKETRATKRHRPAMNRSLSPDEDKGNMMGRLWTRGS